MKRRKRKIPPRLAWPGGGSSSTASISDKPSSSSPSINEFESSTSSHRSGRQKSTSTKKRLLSSSSSSSSSHPPKNYSSLKRSTSKKTTTACVSVYPKHPEYPGLAGDDHNDQTKYLWIDKHAPTTSKELCINPKKTKEVRDWMETSLSARHHYFQYQRLHNNKLRNDTSYDNDYYHDGDTTNSDDYPPLLFLTGNTGIGKSTMCRVLASELDITLLEWNSTHADDLESFAEFLRSSRSGCSPLALISSSESSSQQQQQEPRQQSHRIMVLIDEIPYCHTLHAEESFRSHLHSHVMSAGTIPSIIIHSDVCESSVNFSSLSRWIDDDVWNKTRIISCRPPTERMMLRVLQSIQDKERLMMAAAPRQRGGTLEESIQATQYNHSGDIRQAIMTLQFHGMGNNYHDNNNNQKTTRDVRLSAFHALGKLLYAKRCSDGITLAFDPESVMEESELGMEGALSFLNCHSPDFFTDITDLSQAFDFFSDASLFADRVYDPQRDRMDDTYPRKYISSIAGRSVAVCNKQPSPRKFRPLTAPKLFDMNKKKKRNDFKTTQLSKRLMLRKVLDMDWKNVGTKNRHFVIELLPYLKNIVPHEVDGALQNLYSHARPPLPQNNDDIDDESSISVLQKQEQRQILELDDIIDDDDDENNNCYDISATINDIHNNKHLSLLCNNNNHHLSSISQVSSSQNDIVPSLSSEQYNNNPYDGDEIIDNAEFHATNQDAKRAKEQKSDKRQPEIIVIDDD